MQKLKIPVTLDVRKSAQHQICYKGVVALVQLKRLTQSLTCTEGDVDVNIQTGTDERGLTFLKGDAKVVGQAVCQRCNDKMTLNLVTEFIYSPVKPGYDEDEDEENQLPEYYDAIEVNEFGEIGLRDLIEDELILEVPLITVHDEQVCPAAGRDMTWGEIEEEIVEEKPNPFAVLKQLKRN
jgi:uncharacterized protein